jgi:hypothetical protein
MLNHKSRTLIGFTLAPLVPGCAFAIAFVILHTGTDWSGSFFFLIGLSAVLGYPVAFLIGVPLYILMNHFGWVRPHHYGIAGILLGSIAGMIGVSDKLIYLSLSDMNRYYGHQVLCASGMGVIAAVVFWMIVRPDRISPQGDN